MEQLQHYIEGIVHIDWLTTAISAVVILAVTAVFARLTEGFMRRVLPSTRSGICPQAPSSSTSPAAPCG